MTFSSTFLFKILLFVIALLGCEPVTARYQHPHSSNKLYLPPTTGYESGNSYSNTPSNHYDHGAHDHESAEPKSYEFGYAVKDAQSGIDYNRRESSNGIAVQGEYRVLLPDGRTQIVTYYADWKTGYHADVRYEGAPHYPEAKPGYNYNSPQTRLAPGYHSNVAHNYIY